MSADHHNLEKNIDLYIQQQRDCTFIKDFQKTVFENSLAMFKHVALTQKLDPLLKEIHAVPQSKKFNDNNYYEFVEPVVAFTIYLRRAELSKDLNGFEVTVKTTEGVREAHITIHRKSWSVPFPHSVRMDEYWNDSPIWRNKPETMLKKVAIAQGFRMAFPNEFSDLPYTQEEYMTIKQMNDNFNHDQLMKESSKISEPSKIAQASTKQANDTSRPKTRTPSSKYSQEATNIMRKMRQYLIKYNLTNKAHLGTFLKQIKVTSEDMLCQLGQDESRLFSLLDQYIAKNTKNVVNQKKDGTYA